MRIVANKNEPFEKLIRRFKKAVEKNLNAAFYIKGVEENQLLRIEKFHTNKKHKHIEVKAVNYNNFINNFIKRLQRQTSHGLQKHTA